MPLSDYLSPASVSANLKADNKDQALLAMAELMETSCPGLDRGRVITVLNQREALGSTGIGDGVAIPHGKVEGCKKISVAIGRSVAGCDFKSMDGRPCHIFCMLLAPPSAAAMHLTVLAHFVRILKTSEFRKRFMEAPDEAAIFKLIESAWRD